VTAAEKPPAVPLEKTPVAGPEAVRASDADRDRIADILNEALAEGRLEADEYAERLDSAYRAKTIGELAPLIGDLPAGQPAAGAASRPAAAHPPARHGVQVTGARNVVAVLSGASRTGRWRVGGRINAVAVFGGVELDLTEAVFEQQHVVIRAVAVCGGIEIKVPENVTLRGAGSGVMGGYEVRESESPDAGAPVIVVEGVAVWGGVDAKAVKGKRIRDLTAEA
jgi:hypothetical protein